MKPSETDSTKPFNGTDLALIWVLVLCAALVIALAPDNWEGLLPVVSESAQHDAP